MQRSKIMFITLLAVVVIVIPAITLGFHIRINTTDSMPRGFYREVERQPHVGDLVTVCLPLTLAKFGLERNYISAGTCPGGVEPVLKQVVATGGDVIDLTTKEVLINKRGLPHSQTFERDESNRIITAVARGQIKLNLNDVWLYGKNNAKSWDSRYYGAIDRTSIRSVVVPFLTW